MKKRLILPVVAVNVLVSVSYATAERCAAIFIEAHRTQEIVRTLAPEPREETLVRRYFIQEFKADKVVALETGTRISDIKTVTGIRKLTDRMNIEKVMADFNLSKFQAVEVQALLRRHAGTPTDRQLLSAVEAVRQGQSLSRLDHQKVRDAKFVLAFDIDGTLLDQDSNTHFIPNVHRRSFLVDGSEVHHVALNEGAIELMLKAKELGASVVLFSRNNDLLIWEILNSVEVSGRPLSSYVDGVFTSSHMTLPPQNHSRVSQTSLSRLVRKDLDIIGSDRVFLVDDNAEYVLQQDRMRAVTEFSLDKAIKRSARIDSEFGFFGSERARELTGRDLGKIQEHQEDMIAEYRQIGRELEFLARNPESFAARQRIVSPIGEAAIHLMMGRDRDYMTQLFPTPLSRAEAISRLIERPELIDQVIESKVRRPPPPPPPSRKKRDFFRGER